jgi:hypothetical protein
MTTTLTTVAALATPAAVLLAAIAGTIAEVHPIEYLRFQFGADTSPSWAVGELTGERPVVTVGRHALNVAPGSRSQVKRWGQDTEPLPRITAEMVAEARR